MTQLSLSLLGAFQASLNDETVTGFRTNKVQALLVYLAVEPEPQRRESLMTLLWPGMPERSARHNLRQILYHLRQAIPELSSKDSGDDGHTAVSLLQANRQTIQLNPLAAVTSDAGRFEELLQRVQAHSHVDLLTCFSCRQTLEQAAELYKGDFLSDFYLDDSNEFEEWAEIKRQRYRRQVLDALETLTTIHTRQAAYPEAQRFAQRQLEIDNLRESAYRQLMEIYALNGRREEALALYENCRRLLIDELGMAPTARTTAMYDKIAAGDLRFDAPEQHGVRGFELKEEIGSGAYGTIYRAVQPTIGRDVAVKVIRRKYANDPEFIRRFESEAQTIARLEHPYIVPLYDYWRDPEGAYLVMRLLRGGNLLSALAGGPLPPDTAVTLLSQLASALATAHRQGIVHRDIKPANILFDEANNAYLSDFGIAKDLGHDLGLTNVGALVGTPDYVSPEQLMGQEVTLQSDQYSLGAVLYETLTGEKPFSEEPLAIRIQKHLVEPLPLVSQTRPDLPHQIDTVIQRATAKTPTDRFPDTLTMAEAFRQAVQGTATSTLVATAVPTTYDHDLPNPYKGLRAFQESDAHDFFGRETLVEQLVARVAQSQFLAVVGPSGAGKSSIVKAGLIPALRQGAVTGSESWFVAEMVPGTHPLEELELALLPVAVDPPPSLLDPLQKDERGLLRTLRRILPEENGQLLLVIDQFEELFTLTDSEERRQHFLDSLLAALNAPHSPLHVVVTLRADFYDRPLQMQPLANLFKEHTELVLPMTSEELAWTIQEPARRVGVTFEDGLVAAIVNEVADQPGALPLLQYALTELYEERQGQLMTLTAYHALGGTTGALALRAEEIYGRLDPAAQATTRQLFLRLVTLGEGVEDTRRRVLRSELESLAEQKGSEAKEHGHDGEIVNRQKPALSLPNGSIVNRFGNYRLLTFDRDPLTRQPTVEVAHEALLREWVRLRHWLDESRDDVRLQRLLATAVSEWQQADENPGYLLHGARLIQYEGWATTTTVALTAAEHAFLTASITARSQRQAEEAARQQRELETAQQLAATERQRAQEQAQAAQTLRRRAVYLGVALVVAVILAGLAGLFSQQSARNEAVAVGNAATAVAEGQRADEERDAAIIAQESAQAAANAQATAQVEAEMERERAEEGAATAIAAQATTQAETDIRATAEAIAVDEREMAVQQAQLAFSRELAAGAITNLESNPELSVLLALQGVALTRTIEAENALHTALQTSPVRQTFAHQPGIQPLFTTYSPNGRHVFVSGAGGGTMWNVTTGEVVYNYPVPEGEWINASAFSPDGLLLFLPGEKWDGNTPLPSPVTIIEAETGATLMEFLPHDSYIWQTIVSPDGKLLATISDDGTAKIWDLETTLAEGQGQLVATLCCHEGGAIQGDFSIDSKQLVTLERRGNEETTVWDIASGEKLFTLEITASEAVQFSPDGNYLVTSGLGIIEVWDAVTGQLVSTTPAHNGNVIPHVGFSSDGSLLVSTTLVGEVGIWHFSPDGLQEIQLLVGHKENVYTADFGPNGHYLATISYSDGTTRLWDITPAGRAEGAVFASAGDGDSDLRLIADGSQIVAVGYDGTLNVWNAESEDKAVTLQAHDGAIHRMDISPDGSMIATASDDGTIKLWNTNSWELLFSLEGHEIVSGFYQSVIDVVFSPDGSRLASGGADGEIIVWQTSTGERLSSFTEDNGWILDLDFSPEGTLLASANQDNTVKVWDVATGQSLLLIGDEQSSQSSALDFSSDGSYLLVGRRNHQVELWELPADPWQAADEDVQLIYSVDSQSGFIYATRFSSNGSQLVTTGRTGTVEVRDTATGDLQLTLQLPAASNCAYFTPNGKQLVTCSEDNIIRTFVLGAEELMTLAQSRVTRPLTELECQQYLHVDVCPLQE